jgi:hypothetical protein
VGASVDEAGGSDRAGGAVPPPAAEIDSGRDVAGAALAYERAPVVAGPLGAEVAGVEATGPGSGCHASGCHESGCHASDCHASDCHVSDSSDRWLP